MLVASARIATAGAATSATAARQQNVQSTIEFQDQTANGTTVTVASATLPDGGFILIHNESGAVVGRSNYLDAGTHENVEIEPAPGAVSLSSQMQEMRQLLTDTQTQGTMMAMQAQQMPHGAMQQIMNESGEGTVNESGGHQMGGMMNQTQMDQMMSLMFQQMQDRQRMRALMQSMMESGQHQAQMQEMAQLMEQTTMRERQMLMHAADESREQEQMRQMMRHQMQDYAQMRQLMSQMQAQTQQQRSPRPLTAMLHPDANDNRQLEFPGADQPYTRNGDPVSATGRVRA
ncbi:DUF7282 domain-containing protein [Halomicrococcus gelatinilyticus]|uniref:DUF7282 domain-containing protein n=1 Tax=Halomicrococcus gelatinilyticus TaxID=1702103 RepID=UPI002E14F2DB